MDLTNLKELNKQMNLNFFRQVVATREGFGQALTEIGAKNKDIMAVCADLKESIRIEQFSEKFPERYVEVGVAEQNLVTVASGLAAVGKIPFAASYAVFCPGRCWEQIRTTICYNDTNVKIIGAHTGISVGADGSTHQALEDIALMRVLPNMIVIVPADCEQAKKATKAMAAYKGPAYLRLTRDKTEQMTTGKTPFEIGKAQVWKQGKDIALIGAGPVIYQCLGAAALLQEKGLNAMVINCHTVKPLDKKTILEAAKKCRHIITVEEAQAKGGLGGAIAEFLSEIFPVKIKSIGMQDQFGESGSPDELLKKFGFTAEHICREAMKMFN